MPSDEEFEGPVVPSARVVEAVDDGGGGGKFMSKREGG